MRTLTIPIMIILALTIAAFALATPATAQTCNLNVTGTVYYSSNYGVGLSCSWPSVPGAVKYQVKHARADACGSATVITETTGTSSGSGTHPNCDPDSCYSKTCEIYALNSSGTVLACGSASICDTGCSSGSCSPCDADDVCESGESVTQCVDCVCVPNERCQNNDDCGAIGTCESGFCECF